MKTRKQDAASSKKIKKNKKKPFVDTQLLFLNQNNIGNQ